MKTPSLRIDLIKSLAVPMLAATFLVSILAMAFIYHEVQEVYDATLVQFSKTLAHGATVPSASGVHKGLALGHKYERNVSYRILKNDTLISQSEDAPVLNDHHPLPGFSDHVIGSKEWRLFTLIDEDTGITIEVAEKYSIRHEMGLQLLSSLIIPAICLIFVMILVIWYGSAKALTKLTSLSAQVDQRAVDDLSPIEDASIPVEIRALPQALNRLFARITDSFQREREFSDNAAHELRTPLAAIKTQTQVLLKTEQFSDQGKEGFDNLVRSVNRATDLTESLLTFARLQGNAFNPTDLNFSDLAHEEIAALQKSAETKNIRLITDIEPGLHLSGSTDALAIIIRNVTQNAIKFSPKNSIIDIRIKKVAGTINFSVSDQGSGIPDHLKEQVFDRFYRIDKSAQVGVGLGLAMVKWAAELHKASIELLNNKPCGLIVSMYFPLFSDLNK